MILKRTEEGMNGVFSELCDDQENVLFHVAEHAYLIAQGVWGAKITRGTHNCKRGLHRLHGMDHNFETFEITGIDGHSNLLFHWGNYPQRDSDGCVLVGENRLDDMVTNSRESFAKFMALHEGQAEFILTVV